jgi:hypothetical protein
MGVLPRGIHEPRGGWGLQTVRENHMSKIALTALCGLAAFASGVLAGGTITAGNASFRLLGTPSAFDSNLGDCTLLTDPGMIDQGYKYTWYYRTQNNNQNRFMSFLDSPVETYSGNTATIRYTNAGPGVAGFERFDATITVTLEDGLQPDQARVRSTCVFTSRASTTRVYQLFNLIDLDLAGGVPNSAPDDVFAYNLFTSTVTQTEASSDNVAIIHADNPSKWEVGAASALRAKLNGGANDLNSSLFPFAGDGAAAFQWSLVLAPGESFTASTVFTINLDPFAAICPCIADYDRSGGTPDVADIDAFFTGWLAGAVASDADCSGGTPDVADIDAFFTQWLAGGC